MQIGPFKIDRPIGEGGMATVWGGVHVQLGTPVAFKFMRPKSDKARSTLRFLDETRALARMHHPGVVRIFDAGLCTPELAEFLNDVDVDSPYLVMESVSGGSIKQHEFDSWSQVHRVISHLLDALAHAHARDVIHRDIKPGNVLIETSGLPRLTDFGISRLALSTHSRERMTGTPAYMAPEQISRDSGSEGPWTDLYAVGCLAYWLCTGAAPFKGGLREVLEQHLGAEPPPMESRFPVPAGLESWAKRLLEKDPQARFPRAADAALSLGRLGPAEAIAYTSEASAADLEIFPTLTVIFDLDSLDSLDGETTTGASVDFSSPVPPANWRAPAHSGGPLLPSAGPGMLAHRHPRFRERADERDILWRELRKVHDTRSDRTIAITGPEGVGRTSLWRWFARRAHELGVAHTLVFESDIRRSLAQQLVHWWQSVGGAQGATAFYALRGGLDELAEWDISQIRWLAHGENVSFAALRAIHGRWTERLGHDRAVLLFSTHPGGLDYVRTVSMSTPGRRLLVAEADSADGYDSEIALNRLTDDCIVAIVSELVGVSPDSAIRLATRADGNPGLAVRISRECARRDMLEPGDLGFELRDEDIDAVVESFDHIWTNSLASLTNPTHRAALGLLANIGSRFSESEVAALSAHVGAEADELLVSAAELGFVRADADGLQFASPLARSSARQTYELSKSDHEAVWRHFRGTQSSTRRTATAAFHGWACGEVSLPEIVDLSRRLRVAGENETCVRLLEGVRLAVDDPDCPEHHELTYVLAESFLPLQAYSRALEELRTLPPDFQNRDDPRALILFLSVRQFEDVQDDVLAFDPDSLSETPARMLAYAWMDFGQFERARSLLQNLDPVYDKSAPYFALARLEFLREDWTAAEEWGMRAADGFEAASLPEGSLAALDLVASARLKQGRNADAIRLYRDNLANGRRIAAPVFVQTYNLATCLFEVGQPSEEVDQLLGETVVQAIRRGRTDIEHAARAAQVSYALTVGNLELAKHRLEKLEELELGPWLQADSELHLSNALEFASGELAASVGDLLESIREILSTPSG